MSRANSPNLTQADNGLELIMLGERVRLFKPSSDVLHVEPVEAQVYGCDEVLLGMPYGECGGVRMANQVFTAVSEKSQGHIYGNHVPTHGADANDDFERMGAVFGLKPEEVPKGSPFAISAHGAARSIATRAESQGLIVLDVTCPLVVKTHRAIEDAAEANARGERKIVAYISQGNPEHPEVVAAQGRAQEADVPLELIGSTSDAEELIAKVRDLSVEIVVVGQTTNNSDDAEELAHFLYQRGLDLGVPVTKQDTKYVCHTVRDRQISTREIVRHGVDSLIVVGSVNSKNTMSLAKVAAQEADSQGTPLDIYFTNSWSQLPNLQGKVGVVSGASTRARNVDGVIARLNPQNEVLPVGKDTDGAVVFKPLHMPTRRILEGIDTN